MTTEELTRLFQQYGNDVYRFAYSITRHTADAEDICQTIFCRLAKGNIVPRKKSPASCPSPLQRYRQECREPETC